MVILEVKSCGVTFSKQAVLTVGGYPCLSGNIVMASSAIPELWSPPVKKKMEPGLIPLKSKWGSLAW
jgi:hypothetical protein